MTMLDSGSVVSVFATSKEEVMLSIAPIGRACAISRRPVRPTIIDHPIISKNGKRLPLAAFDYHELNRRFWTQGTTLFQSERKRAVELQAHDKQPEDMSIDELLDTQDRDPLTESRRAWLELGAKTLHLEPDDGDDDGSLEETLEVITYEDVGDDRNQQHFGTAFTTINPITAKQIDWEKRVHGDGQLRKLTIVDGEVRPDRPYPTMAEFFTVAPRALRLLLPMAEHGPTVKLNKERVKELCKRFDDYVNKTIDYATVEDDKAAHGHWTNSEGTTMFHGVKRLSLEEEVYGPYHAVPQDRSELAIFNHEGSDEAVEAMMGTVPCEQEDCNSGLVPLPDPWAGEATAPPICMECSEEAAPSMRFLAQNI